MREENYSSWSHLPILILWTIMDCLNFVDNMQLSAVCKDWHYASTSNPKKLQSAGDSLPWIKQSSCKFFCISTKKSYVIDLPDLRNPHSSLLCSKDGWFLFDRNNPDHPGFSTAVLLNPFTKDEIQLPESLSLQYGVFSTLNGIPQLVGICCGSKILKTIRVGDKLWRNYTFKNLISTYAKRRSELFFQGDEVYFFDGHARATVLNLSTLELRLFRPSYTHARTAVFQLEGKLFVRITQQVMGVFEFYKMNSDCTDWVQLDEDNEDDRRIADRSWFFGTSSKSFCAKERGLRKVYWGNGTIGPNSKYGRNTDPYQYVKVFNLVDGTVEWFCYPNVAGKGRWIDMG